MSLIAYKPLAIALRPFLDDPPKLHIAITFFYKILLDVWSAQTNRLLDHDTSLAGSPKFPLYWRTLEECEIVASSVRRQRLDFMNDWVISEEVIDVVAKMDINDLWIYLTRQWFSTHGRLGRPDETITYMSRSTAKLESAISGKVFLLDCALFYLKPSPAHNETFRLLISPQPTSTLKDARPNYPLDPNISHASKIPELNKAMEKYLVYSYTMTNAPTHRRVDTLSSNIFTRANGGILEPIEYPHGAPLARGPRDEAIKAVLSLFVRMGVNISDVWIHFHEPTIVQYRTALAQTHKQFLWELENPFSEEIPGRVKEDLAALNFRGAFAMVWAIVKELRHGAHTHLASLGYAVYEAVVHAATAPEVDPRGTVARVVEKTFGRPDSVDAAARDAYFRPRAWDSIHLDWDDFSPDPDSNDISNCPLDLAEKALFDTEGETQVRSAYDGEYQVAEQAANLVGIGPEIDVSMFAERLQDAGALGGSLTCTVCLEKLTAGCVRLDGCGHVFHEECIVEWVNGVAEGSNTCPECRAVVCERREVRQLG
jgi:hypothetical protein